MSGAAHLVLFLLGIAMAFGGGYLAAKEKRRMKCNEPRIAGVERRKTPR